MNPESILVYCTTCGTAMERRDDPHGDPGRECWLWFNLAGGLADKCPGCGAVTSALTTTVHPSTRSVLREVWDRRASVDELGRGYDVHLDAELAERIRVVLVHPGAHQADDLAEIVQLLQRLTAEERRLVMYPIRRFAGVPVG